MIYSHNVYEYVLLVCCGAYTCNAIKAYGTLEAIATKSPGARCINKFEVSHINLNSEKSLHT